MGQRDFRDRHHRQAGTHLRNTTGGKDPPLSPATNTETTTMKTLTTLALTISLPALAYAPLCWLIREYAEVAAAVLIGVALFAPGLITLFALCRAGRDATSTND